MSDDSYIRILRDELKAVGKPADLSKEPELKKALEEVYIRTETIQSCNSNFFDSNFVYDCDINIVYDLVKDLLEKVKNARKIKKTCKDADVVTKEV